MLFTTQVNKLRQTNHAINVKTCVQQFSNNVTMSVAGCKMQWWLSGHVTMWWWWRWNGRQKCDDGLYAAVLNSKIKRSLRLLVGDVNVSVMLQIPFNSSSSTTTGQVLHYKSTTHHSIDNCQVEWDWIEWQNHSNFSVQHIIISLERVVKLLQKPPLWSQARQQSVEDICRLK